MTKRDLRSKEQHSAPGQALGYVYQFDRATMRLFLSDVDVIAVGVEDLNDDVVVHKKNGDLIREQDKSTISGSNPLADRSEGFWKTLHIWASDILCDKELLERTEFHFVTNGNVTDSCLAMRIGNAHSEGEARLLAKELRDLAATLRDDLESYGKTVLRLPFKHLEILIRKIHTFDRQCPHLDSDLASISLMRYLPPVLARRIFANSSAWVCRQIRHAIEMGCPPRVQRKDFEREVGAMICSCQAAPLVSMIPPVDQGVDWLRYRPRGFVQQLNWIHADESMIREAVIHFVHAMHARVVWAEDGTVPESSIKQYETDLVDRWRSIQRQSRRSSPSPELQGQDCYEKSISVSSVLQNQILPLSLTAGSYHQLADFDESSEAALGWHPDYENLSSANRKR